MKKKTTITNQIYDIKWTLRYNKKLLKTHPQLTGVQEDNAKLKKQLKYLKRTKGVLKGSGLVDKENI